MIIAFLCCVEVKPEMLFVLFGQAFHLAHEISSGYLFPFVIHVTLTMKISDVFTLVYFLLLTRQQALHPAHLFTGLMLRHFFEGSWCSFIVNPGIAVES